MFVPIHYGIETRGILSIQSYSYNAYTPADLQTLQALADLLAAAGGFNADALHEAWNAWLRSCERPPAERTIDTPLEGLLLEACRLRDEAEAARAVNDALMRLSRILNPVIYSASGRFHHDPAEWSPIMRATGQHTLAALQKAGGLPALAGQAGIGQRLAREPARRDAARADCQNTVKPSS